MKNTHIQGSFQRNNLRYFTGFDFFHSLIVSVLMLRGTNQTVDQVTASHQTCLLSCDQLSDYVTLADGFI